MSVDIVNLVERNPITKFKSNTYQNKLVEKIRNSFNNYEQQLFLSSFYCFMKYDKKTDFVVNLDTVWKWLDFSQKDAAKRLLIKYFIRDVDYVVSHESDNEKKSGRGGHNKEIIMLNIDTFKRFCLKAGTNKADEIHCYFIKLEEIIFELTNEQTEELINQINETNQQLEYKTKEMESRIVIEKMLEREKTLLEKYANTGALIYIIKVKTYEDGSYVIKIGESRMGIRTRYNEHKTNYEECVLLDCFPVEKSKNFEKYLHSHPTIRPNKVTNLEKHEKENELFLVGKHLTYKIITDIIQKSIQNYNHRVDDLLSKIELLESKMESLEAENKMLKSRPFTQDNDNTNTIVHQPDNSFLQDMCQKLFESNKTLIESNKTLTEKISSLEQILLRQENKESKPPQKEVKTTTGFGQQLPQLGPRLQKINADTMQLVRVYDSVTEAMNENKNIKRPSIMKAAKDNTVYCGFRWFLVERNADATVLSNIPPTKQTKQQNLGYIAKLNREKNQILNVYLDRKTAAQLNGYASTSALDNPVKNNTLTNGYYYMLYDMCDEDIVAEYEEKHGTPLLYKDGVGVFDENNHLVTEFRCKYDCIREGDIGEKTLAKVFNKDIAYNNHYYRSIGAKINL